MVRDPAALHRRRPDLDRAHPARLGQAGLDDGLVPLVERLRRHRVQRRLDDEIRRPAELLAKFHTSSLANVFGGGMSFGSPCGAPASTHRTMVSICSSVSERSFLKCWMPTVLSMCHGGICRAATRALIDLRPRARLLVGHERHRRDVARAVAGLTLVLQDRRDVFGEDRCLHRFVEPQPVGGSATMRRARLRSRQASANVDSRLGPHRFAADHRAEPPATGQGSPVIVPDRNCASIRARASTRCGATKLRPNLPVISPPGPRGYIFRRRRASHYSSGRSLTGPRLACSSRRVRDTSNTSELGELRSVDHVATECSEPRSWRWPSALLWLSVRHIGSVQLLLRRRSNGEWPHYTADLRGTKYSPLDQINASNFNKLEVAWRFKTDSLGTRPEYKLEGTPLMVGGVLYTTGGTRRSVVALDARAASCCGCIAIPRARAARPRRASSPDAASPTGPMAEATIACCT